MTTLEKIRAEIEQIKPYELPCDKRTPEHIKDMALAVIDKYAEQEPTSPCDLCRFNPPSSADGKPCTMCPAEKGGE